MKGCHIGLRDQSLSILLVVMGSLIAPSVRAEVSQNLSLALLQTQYLTPGVENKQQEQYSDLRARFEILSQSRDSKVKANVGGIYSLNRTGDNHLIVPELSYSRKFADDTVRLTFGRQLFPWSWSDDHWGLGVWQPQFRWDSIRPEAQGLSGVFLHVRRPSWQVMGFLSPLFLPEQGPQFEIDNGRIESANRWFESPVERVRLGADTTDVVYEIKRPAVSDVIDRQSFGLWSRLGNDQEGFWIQAGLARKPFGKFHLGIDPVNEVGLNMQSRTRAVIHPVLVNHSVATLEGGWSDYDWQTRFSLTGERPDRPRLPERWLESELNSLTVAAAQVARRVRAFGVRDQRLSLTYLKVFEDPVRREDGLVSSREAASLKRLHLSEAVELGWRAVLSGRVRGRWTAGFDYMYSVTDGGTYIAARTEYAPSASWFWHVRFDVLGADADATSGFFARNRANDRVQGGFTYVF